MSTNDWTKLYCYVLNITEKDMRYDVVSQISDSERQSWDKGHKEGLKAGQEDGYIDGLKGQYIVSIVDYERNPHVPFYSDLHNLLEKFKADEIDLEQVKKCLSDLTSEYYKRAFAAGFQEGHKVSYPVSFEQGEVDAITEEAPITYPIWMYPLKIRKLINQGGS